MKMYTTFIDTHVEQCHVHVAIDVIGQTFYLYNNSRVCPNADICLSVRLSHPLIWTEWYGLELIASLNTMKSLINTLGDSRQ